MTNPPPCLHCGLPAKKVLGHKLFPGHPMQWCEVFWSCWACSAHVGCHPKSDRPLGFPADRRTRRTRKRLHNEMLDPLWKHVGRKKGRFDRQEIYDHMGVLMGLPRHLCHVGMFTIEQCQEAWVILVDLHTPGKKKLEKYDYD